MKRRIVLSFLGLIMLITYSSKMYSQETGHYVPGIMGIKAATLPPPGSYYVMHNVYYTAGNFYDGNGQNAAINFNLNVYVNAQRFVHVWKNVIFGANYAVNLIVPLINTNISIGAFDINDKKFGVGDVILDPLVLSWNKKRYDIALGAGVVMPTGSYDITEPASPGKGFWTGLFTFGGTYYFDSNRTWTASLLSRYEIHSEKKGSDIIPGNDFTFEWGLGKTIHGKAIWTVGASGYAHWQVTEDKGSDILYDKTVKDRIFSAGPEIDVFIPSIKLGIEMRGLFEYGAIERPEGTTICLTLLKAF